MARARQQEQDESSSALACTLLHSCQLLPARSCYYIASLTAAVCCPWYRCVAELYGFPAESPFEKGVFELEINIEPTSAI